MRSPVSEIWTGNEVRKVRSAELHGAGAMSPVSELVSESAFGGGFAELGDERAAPVGNVEREGEGAKYRGRAAMNL
jgi:hypothetical protein